MGALALDAEWRRRAACRGMEPDLWFPHSEQPEDEAPAKAVCATCPVRLDCLEFALVTRQDDGVWGGVGPRERRRMVKRAGWRERLAEMREAG